MKIYWYRVNITAKRKGETFRRDEMVADVEATSAREAIDKARRNERTMINKCYQRAGRRFTARCLGTTEELRNDI